MLYSILLPVFKYNYTYPTNALCSLVTISACLTNTTNTVITESSSAWVTLIFLGQDHTCNQPPGYCEHYSHHHCVVCSLPGWLLVTTYCSYCNQYHALCLASSVRCGQTILPTSTEILLHRDTAIYRCSFCTVPTRGRGVHIASF